MQLDKMHVVINRLTAVASGPTRTRYWVVAFGVSLAFITYIDRACIGQTAPAIRQELRLTPVQMGYVFSAFALAYALFEIPSGWLGDWIGSRRLLTRIVLWWSFFTAATGWAWSLQSLVVTRFLFGAGEAGCFPSLAKSFSVWLPRSERPMAEGIKALSARWGGAVTPIIIVILMQHVSWRVVFEIFGGLGVVWAALFYFWYRDDPGEHPSVNGPELALIGRTTEKARGNRDAPWGRFLTSRSSLLLCIQWFCYFYGFYFYLTWLPTYLQQGRGMAVNRSALLASLPLFTAGAGSLLSGVISTWFYSRTMDLRRWRRTVAVSGFCCATLLFVWFITIRDPTLAMAALSASSFAAELSGPISWVTSMDLGGRYVGSLSGAMNTMGHLAGIVAPTLTGYVLQSTGNWNIAFAVSAGIYSFGILCWLFIDPVTPLDRPSRSETL